MLFNAPKSMQQIATLIITFAVYVAGIRNAGSNGSGSNVDANVDYASYSAPYNEGFRPSQQLSEVTEIISTVNNNAEHKQEQTINSRGDFQPSQIISFTNSDAQSTLKKYPPSYVEPNYYAQQISKGGPYGLAPYNNEEKQFSFPHAIRQQAATLPAYISKDMNLEKYLFSSAQQQQQSTTQQTLVPTQLHTTPIHIYRDPYTNKINTNHQQQQQNYHPAPEPILQAQYVEAGEPQEYTVQSMLVVGGGTKQQRPPQYAAEGGGGHNKRPGYVVDDAQVKPSYNRPITNTNYADYKRRDGATQTTEQPYRGTAAASSTKISYDSHDYPPPTYYKQQTSNFQSPLRQENTPNKQQTAYATTQTSRPTTTAISSGSRPELTSSNYVNKFGNYLKDGGGSKSGHDGYYKRPSSHYSNDILYVTPAPPTRPSESYYPQVNEPIRRPPIYNNNNNNYNQYQIGEIPPQAPQPPRFVESAAQRQPPAEYYNTPQHYPSAQSYPTFETNSPSQNYAPQLGYPAAQHYPAPHNYAPPPPPSYSAAPTQYYPTSQNYPAPPPPPNYRPPYPQYQVQQPTAPSAGGVSGLATLASLFTGTQQYAPQFANLLLGGNGGAGGAGGGLLQALTGTRPSSSAGNGGRPPNMQLIKALENIARNDDLECVPKVLCNMIASQTQRGQLPNFITSPAITNFLAGFPAQSPALIYGRAALLGISGGERSCTQTYAKCPKNEYEILYYLNNHRGGFFKFFSESEEQKPQPQQTQQSSSSSAGTSLFDWFSALTGANEPPITTTTPRPTPPPTVASFDITQGIGNFFTNILSEYISGVEYQRRSGRARRAVIFEDERPEKDERTEDEKMPEREENPERAEMPTKDVTRIQFPKDTDSVDFHDEEDEEDTAQSGEDFQDDPAADAHESAEYGDTQGRVVFQASEHDLHFFPADDASVNYDKLKDYYLMEVIKKFNAAKSERKLKFPLEKDVERDEGGTHDDGKVVHFQDEHDSYVEDRPEGAITFRDEDTPNGALKFKENRDKEKRRGKTLKLQAVATDLAREENEVEYESNSGRRVIFPDHYEQHIRKGKILNRPILYASNYDEYMQNAHSDRFVISNSQRPTNNNFQNNEDNNIESGEKQLGPFYYSASATQHNHNTQSTHIQVNNGNRLHYNRGADTQTISDNNNRYTPASSANSANYNGNRYSAGSSNSNYYKRPSYSSSSTNNRYNYPSTNYVSNNRYGNRYQTTTATTRPREDDHNIYVTNAQGVTTHYITPNGRKVHLKR